MSTLEQSMKAAIDTLAKLDELKSEVVELTATRDSLRDVTKKLEDDEAKWLSLQGKIASMQEQAEATANATIQAALDEATKRAAKIESDARDNASAITTSAVAEAERIKAETARLNADLATARSELATAQADLTATGKLYGSMHDEVERLKKAIASL